MSCIDLKGNDAESEDRRRENTALAQYLPVKKQVYPADCHKGGTK